MILDDKKVRRLGCEQAIARKGFTTFQECAIACQDYVDKHGLDITFNRRSISHFVNGTHDMSSKRLIVVLAVLGVDSLKEITEKYTAPATRGCGQLWKGEYGSVIVDYDSTQIKRKFEM